MLFFCSICHCLLGMEVVFIIIWIELTKRFFFENERSWKLSVYVCYVPVRHDSNQRDGWEYRNLALQKTDNYLATSLCVLTQYDDVVHRKTQLVKSFDVLNLIKYTKCLEFMYYNNQLRFIDLKFYTFGLVYLRHSLLILFLYLRTAWIFFLQCIKQNMHSCNLQ